MSSSSLSTASQANATISRTDGEAESQVNIAAVDLGSNSFHLVVAQIRDGQPVIIERLKEMVRLGAGLDSKGRLSEEAQARALDCLGRFGQCLTALSAQNVRVVGTNTLRKATGNKAFLLQAEQLLGHEVEIISGAEEARLIYKGVALAAPADDSKRLVIDIGGGSTEIIVGSGLEPRVMKSLPLGCISMTKELFADGKITRKRVERTCLRVRAELGPLLARYRSEGWQQCIGASGTVKSAAKVLALEPSERIERQALEGMMTRFIEHGIAEPAIMPGLGEDRAAAFAGGAAVLLGLFRAFDIDSMAVSEGALREGVLAELGGPKSLDNVRQQTVAAFQNRYSVDVEHADRVAATAKELWQAVRKSWGLTGPRHKKPLLWAAHLHEIGLDIAHVRYHHHGAYILAHADMMGFSRSEQSLMAALVRMHRQRFSPENAVAELPERQQQTAVALAVLLRVAVALQRGRNAASLPTIAVDAGPQRLRLRFPAGSLDEYPLTLSELERESNYLADANWLLEWE